MSTTTKWVLGILVGFVVLSVGVVALGIGIFVPVRGAVDEPAQGPIETPVIADGDWFAFVTVGTDESGAIVLGVDLAELLTGEAARQAAIDAGVIGEGEDLPNDVFIDNPDRRYELLSAAEYARILVISGDDTSGLVEVGVEGLAALHDGTWTGDPVYGIVAGEPIAMEVTIEGGLVTEASAVY
ncbi:MAG: hypothetical protein AB1Z57_08420, partial [Acidimicrobiia bacterium]